MTVELSGAGFNVLCEGGTEGKFDTSGLTAAVAELPAA